VDSLRTILANSPEHSVTYKNIKDRLVREFGSKAFEAQKEVVRTLVLEEVNRRAALKPVKAGKLSLQEDLCTWLEVCACVWVAQGVSACHLVLLYMLDGILYSAFSISQLPLLNVSPLLIPAALTRSPPR
jgi:hypothetical protein